MKTFENFNSIEDNIEELFLELAHLDELEIRFDFIKYDKELFYFYNDEWLFDKDSFYKDMYLCYEKMWLKFNKKFDINSRYFREVITDIVNKHFNLTEYRVSNLSIVNW